MLRSGRDRSDTGGFDDRLVGKIGHITVPVRPGGLGEVVVAVRGGSERFAASCDEPLAKGTEVVIVEERSGRSVTVTPFSIPGVPSQVP